MIIYNKISKEVFKSKKIYSGFFQEHKNIILKFIIHDPYDRTILSIDLGDIDEFQALLEKDFNLRRKYEDKYFLKFESENDFNLYMKIHEYIKIQEKDGRKQALGGN